MQIVIDIDKRDYEVIKITPQIGVGKDCIPYNAYKAIRNGTVLPDNPTNGDMIKAMFPDEEIYHCEDCIDLGDICTFYSTWWNAPYERSTNANSD